MINDQPRFAGVAVGSLTAAALIIAEAGTNLAATIIRADPRIVVSPGGGAAG